MTNLIVLLAAILISWLVFNLLIKIVKTSLNTAFLIATFILCLQIFFGVSPREIWHEIVSLPQTIQGVFVK